MKLKDTGLLPTKFTICPVFPEEMGGPTDKEREAFFEGCKYATRLCGDLEVLEPLDEGKVTKILGEELYKHFGWRKNPTAKKFAIALISKFGTPKPKVDEGRIMNILNSPNFDVALGHNEKLMKDIATAIKRELEG